MSSRPLALGCRPKISMEDFQWYRASGPSAHSRAQQCCVNVAKRVQHRATSKMLHEKFDRFQIWSNIIQHVATYRNRVAKRTQHVVPNNVARCCVEMLRAFGQALRSYDGNCNESVPLKLVCVKLSLLRLFYVDHVGQNRRTALSLAWYEWFSCKGKEWKIYCCELPLSSEQEPIAIQHCLRWEGVGMKPRSSPLVFSSNAQSLGIPIFIQRLRERLVFHSQQESPDVLVERLQPRTHGRER